MDNAFAQANGAHLVLEFDGHVPAAELVATSHAAPVTDSAGPWPVAPVGFTMNRVAGDKGGGIFVTDGPVSGRSRPDTSVDRVVVSAGRWWQAAR